MGNETGSDSRDVSSVELKFGMDRILAKDPHPSPSSPVNHEFSPPFPREPPCSECISSIFRCCARASPFFTNESFSSQCAILHAPRPIRPFSNIVLEKDDRNGIGKRKRSWSRAVFSNLQRKGLERRFQMQQYITKPDRRQLAATLGLTDAQVKVWFQNRRMKWRHAKEMKCNGNVAVSSGLHRDKRQSYGVPNEETKETTRFVSNISFVTTT